MSCQRTFGKYCDTHHVIVLTDLCGGSVNRMFMAQLCHYRFHLISNMNLGLLLELALTTEPIDENLLYRLLTDQMVQGVYCNDLLKKIKKGGESI